MMKHYSYTTTKIGRRQQQQDALVSKKLQDMILNIIMDANQKFGEILSNAGIRLAVGEFVCASFSNASLNSRRELESLCKNAVRKTAETLAFLKKGHDNCSAGSTITASVITNRWIVSSYIGDSPLFLYQKNQLKLLTHPMHTLAERLISEHGLPESIRHDPLKAYLNDTLTECIGSNNCKENTVSEELTLPALALCSSDGVLSYIREEDICRAIENTGWQKYEELRALCELLLEKAVENGSGDNQSLIATVLLPEENEKTKFYNN